MNRRVATLPEAHAVLSGDPADDLELWSPENAAETQGVLWFFMLQKALCDAFPERRPPLILDCGARGDLAIEAFRLGMRHVALRAPATVTAKVEDVAQSCGGRLFTEHFPN